MIIEVKPKKYTVEPKIPKRKTKSFVKEVYEWGKNTAKWKLQENIVETEIWIL